MVVNNSHVQGAKYCKLKNKWQILIATQHNRFSAFVSEYYIHTANTLKQNPEINPGQYMLVTAAMVAISTKTH